MKQNKALTTSEAVRGRLNVTGAARRDAIERARGHLPSYTDDDVDEITGKYAALAADAAANAVADALTDRISETSMQGKQEPRGVELTRKWSERAEHVAKVTAAVTGIAGALLALYHWLRKFIGH